MMNKTKLDISKKKSVKAICLGTGLLALDVIVNGNPNTVPKILAGGSCGNVLTILSYLGWQSYPIARLSKKQTTRLLFNDLKKHKVNLDLISQTDDGSTPIIIHRILKDSENNPKHRYEFRIPETDIWFPQYKPVLANAVENIQRFPKRPKVFYIDRVNRAAIDLAKYYKQKSTLVFFEPSSISDEKQFKELLAVTDIVKFSNDRIPEYKELYPKRFVPIEIETLGANGLLYRSYRNKTNEWKFLPAVQISNAIDTAGAGDWCSAGIIHALFQSLNDTPADILSNLTKTQLEQIFSFGQFLSALNCNFYGARGAMYNLKLSQIIQSYSYYLKTKEITINKAETGFSLSKYPFDYHKLL